MALRVRVWGRGGRDHPERGAFLVPRRETQETARNILDLRTPLFPSSVLQRRSVLEPAVRGPAWEDRLMKR